MHLGVDQCSGSQVKNMQAQALMAFSNRLCYLYRNFLNWLELGSCQVTWQQVNFFRYKRAFILRIIYVLPKQDYFVFGLGGRVSHAIGVADTLAQQGTDVTVLSGCQAAEHLHFAKVVEVETGDAWTWHGAMFSALDELLNSSTEKTTVIVRYGVSNAVLFVSRMRRRCPTVMWCFEVNSLAYHQYPGVPSPLRHLFLALEARIVGQAGCSYVIAEVLREDIQPRLKPVHRCLVVPNGGPAPIRLPPMRPGTAFRFVFFGMMKTYNNMEVMIEGFLHARNEGLDAELHVHGDGPLYEQVKRMADQDPNIHVHGRYDLPALLKNELSDTQCVLLLPSRDGDGLNRIQSPIKLGEYMATGLPIIASDMSQMRKTLVNEKTAILVNPRSAEAWGQAMLKLKSSDQLRLDLSRQLRECYPTFSWDHRMKQLLEGLNQHFNNPDRTNAETRVG